jgi:hypothetical protein
LGSGIQDCARTIIADFVGKPCRNIQNEERQGPGTRRFLPVLKNSFGCPCRFLDVDRVDTRSMDFD